MPINPEFHPAAKIVARVSVLLFIGQAVCRTVSRKTGIPFKYIVELGNSKGVSKAHFDDNDTGAGNKVHGHVPWGLASLKAAGFTYRYGDEGLPDGRHRGEPLLHMVMIISKHCTIKESQVILGLDEGDSSCAFQFPELDPSLPNDQWRMALYFVDYSLKFHGNPVRKFQMHEDALMFRITPYGTSHCATWAGILSDLHLTDREKARDLLASIAELPGAPKLGEKAGRYMRGHPDHMRAGRQETPECGVSEGVWAHLHELGRGGALVAQGQVLHVGGATYIGNHKFERGVHIATEVDMPKRKRCVA
jgi:hypothetical protein